MVQPCAMMHACKCDVSMSMAAFCASPNQSRPEASGPNQWVFGHVGMGGLLWRWHAFPFCLLQFTLGRAFWAEPETPPRPGGEAPSSVDLVMSVSLSVLLLLESPFSVA